MKIQGPFEFEIKVSFTNGEGVDGVVTISLGKGCFPSETEMREAIAKVERETLPDGFRLMTKREWWDTLFPPSVEEDEDGEEHRTHFAIPGGDDYDE